MIFAQDFNAIEYLQKVRFYLPRLRDAGVSRVACVLTADAAQCRTLAELLDVPDDVELFSDPTGEAGRKYGVNRGFRPDDDALSPYVKLFVVGIGLGPPWGTLLPAATASKPTFSFTLSRTSSRSEERTSASASAAHASWKRAKKTVRERREER